MSKLLYISSSRIGDAILATGILRHFIDQNPGIQVTIASAPLTLSLFRCVPGLEILLTFEKKPFKRHWIDLWIQTAAKTWDVVIDMRGSLVPWTLRAKKRVIWHHAGKTGHQVEKVSQCLYGNSHIPPLDPYLWVDDEDLQRARSIMAHRPTLALAPTASWMGKAWPLDRFQGVVERFLRDYPSGQVAFFGGPYESEQIKSIWASLPEDTQKNRVLDLTQLGDLSTVAAFLKSCTLFLGNDSGLMHMSAAVGTPTIALFGPTNDLEYGPWGQKHQVIRTPLSRQAIITNPSFSWNSQGKSYLESLDVDQVYHRVSQMWSRLLSSSAPPSAKRG